MHGWLGNPHELRYLQKALETQHHHQQSSSGKNNNDDATTKSVLFVHAATANDGRTNDGVLAGGRRLAEEINDWIDRVILQFQHEYPEEEEADLQQSTATSSSPPPSLGPHISLSLVGNSLGGLYARCALKDIRWHRSASVGILRRIEIQPAVFCTIATPHLGVAWPHSYLPNPQLMKGAAWFLSLVGGDSLRDLFFVPSSEERGVLEDLAMQSAFVDPLSAFRHRLALANAYPTDFQVPLSTAAFLSRTPSRHNHPKEENNDYWVHTDDDARSTVASDSNYNNPQCSTIAINTTKEPNEHSWLALMVETNRNIADETLPLDPSPLLQTPSLNNNNSADSTIHGNNEKSANLGVKSTTTDEMALRLDALGWTKVFCDMRQNVPSLPIPFWPVAAAGTLEQLDDATVTPPPAVDTNVFFPTRDDNKDNSVYYTSTELWDRFSPYLSKLPSSSTSPEQEHQQYRYFLPLGHTVLVANAKNEQYAQLNAAGQPVMDALATRLLRLVSSHSPPTTKNKMLAPKIRL